MTNAVKNYMVKLDEDLNEEKLKKIANYINENYERDAFSDIFQELKSQLEEDSDEVAEISRSALKIIDSITDKDIENEIYWQGLEQFMDEKGNQDISITRKIFKIFTDRKELINLVKNELPNRGLSVYIGEGSCEMFEGCSMVTSGYMMRGRTVGRIGIVGPTKMDYIRALGTVGCLSELISSKLQEINN